MFGFRFTVDTNLIVRSLDMLQDDVTENRMADFVGLPYNHVFPTLIHAGVDAVETVMREGTPLSINGYRAVCFCGDTLVDVCINPLRDQDGLIVGAEIVTQAGGGCAFLANLQRERRLIGIGKNSAKLAHGVRNPLNAIKGAVVYLKDKYGKEATLLEFAEIIEEEISKLDGFITRFLSNSLIEPEHSQVQINGLLQKILTMSNFQAYEKNTTFVTEFSTIPEVKADAFQLEHAIMNVINNSLEAMAGGGTILLKTMATCANDQRFVAIEISDTGSGMSQEGIGTLAGQSANRPNGAGRGFGLFITREIIQCHGGHMEIVSKKNLGTRVTLYIPI
jgi:two-component system, NtrC family, nitrogen regulation sensor histidine kinase GlnL